MISIKVFITTTALLLSTTITSNTCTAAPSSSTATSSDYELPLKTLVISESDIAFAFPELVALSFGGNYEIISFSKQTENDIKLYNSDNTPKYNSIILTHSNLGSKVSVTKWQEIYDYQNKFKVRSVFLYSSPAIDRDNLVAAAGFENGSSDNAVLSFIPNNADVEAIRSNVKSTATFSIGQVNEFVKTNYYYYPTYLKANPSSNIKYQPLMYLNRLNSNTDNWMAAFTRQLEGREELHFLINTDQYGHHGFVLADMWFPWINRGIFLGQRRLYLDTQIDDVFLSTAHYNVEANRPAEAGEPAYRQSAEDIEQLVKYQNNLNQNILPAGSSYTVQMGYNADGWFEFENVENSMNPAVITHRDEFMWMSHTYSHFDLYCPYSDCDTNGFTSYNQTYTELNKNIQFNEKVFYADLSIDQINSEGSSYNHLSLITPRISGLNLSTSVEAMLDNGITTAVGDNSRPELRPKNPFHTLPSVPDRKGRTVAIIPRFPTSIYFDVTNPEQAAAEYNSFYGPKCIGYDMAVPITYPFKCNTTSFKYTRDLTFEEIIMQYGFTDVRSLLNYRHDPFMFHQGNLRFYEDKGKTTCLMCTWTEAVLGYITQYSEMPVNTLKMDTLLTEYEKRMSRENCGIEAVVHYVNGQPQAIRAKATKAANCVAKVTTTKTSGFDRVITANSEKYGPDNTIDLSLQNGQYTSIGF
eukprot:Pgem_evm1s10639